MSASSLRGWLRSQPPFALAMSSGFFGFFAHTGFLSVLEDEGLLPVRMSGSSAGALVAGLFGAGLSTASLDRELSALRREDFWDVGLGAGLLRGRLFQEKVEALLSSALGARTDATGGRTFDACRIPVSVSALRVRTWTTDVLEEGALAPALCASCAVPGLFHPVRVESARTRGHYWDGGVLDRPGLLGLRAHEAAGGPVLFHHLESRSPWRTADSLAAQIPQRENVVTVVLTDLPRSGPFKLDAGRAAMKAAREKMRRALDAPIEGGVVRI